MKGLRSRQAFLTQGPGQCRETSVKDLQGKDQVNRSWVRLSVEFFGESQPLPSGRMGGQHWGGEAQPSWGQEMPQSQGQKG